MAEAKWFVSELSPDHSDSRRTLRDWISGPLEGSRIERVTVFDGKKGASIGNHFHDKQTEIYFILRGNGRMVLLDLDSGLQEMVAVGPYTRVVIPPRIAHLLYFDTDILLEIASTKKFDPKDLDMTAYDLKYLS